MPPPHQSESIVIRYAPLIEQMLKAWPEVSVFAPNESFSESTFVARFRDSIRALALFKYDNVKMPLDLLAKLDDIVKKKSYTTSYKDGKLFVGPKAAMRLTHKKDVVGQLVATKVSGLQESVTTESEEVLKAFAVLLKARVLTTVRFKGLPLEKVQGLNLGIEVQQLPEGDIMLYE